MRNRSHRLWLCIAAAVAVVVVGVPAVSASARRSSAKPRTTHFTVFDKTIGHHPTANGDGVVFRDILAKPNDRDQLVGHLRGVIRPCAHHGGSCFLNKDRVHIFGAGDLKVRQKFLESAPDLQNERLIIIGGTGEFNGAAGKMIEHVIATNPDRELLKFDFVQ